MQTSALAMSTPAGDTEKLRSFPNKSLSVSRHSRPSSVSCEINETFIAAFIRRYAKNAQADIIARCIRPGKGHPSRLLSPNRPLAEAKTREVNSLDRTLE